MIRKLIVYIILSLITCLSLNAQPWLYGPTTKSGSAESFDEIRQRFNQYWLTHKREKGKGWKQFKRWEAFMRPRVYPDKQQLQSASLVQMLNQSDRKQLKSSSGTWVSLGPSSVPRFKSSRAYMGAGRINTIAFHPENNSVLWAGAPSGGFWKSTDGGSNWKTTTDMLPSIGVSDIVVDFNNPDVLYIASGDGDAGDTYSLGVLVSKNGGESWDTTSLSFVEEENIIIRRLAMSHADPLRIIAAADEGIYLTTDGWKTNTLIRKGHFKDVEFNPGNALIVYAASYSEDGEAKIYRSSDGGRSFNQSMTGMTIGKSVDRIELAVSKGGSDYVYALCSKAEDGGFHSLWKSSDEGVSWSKMNIDADLNLLGWERDGSDIGGQGWYDLSLAVSPVDASVVFVGGVNIWKSTNGGSVWSLSSDWQVTNRSKYVHADIHELCFSPSGDLYAGSDGGVYVTSDLGNNWNDISDGLEILQIYRMGSSADDDVFVAGSQDNGTYVRDADGKWHAVLDGDGFVCYIDPQNSNIVYGAYYYGDIYKSYNQGRTFFRITPADAIVDNEVQGAWLTPYIISKHDNAVLYAGYDKLYKTVDAGTSWKAVSDVFDADEKLRIVVESPSDENVMFVATINGIWKTEDGCETWEKLPAQLPDLAISDIAVHPTDPDKIWVSLSGYVSGNKAYMSFDGGQHFVNYSSGLPNLPVNCLYYVDNTNKLLYAGTDNGIYFRNNSMDAWENCNGNLPNVVVSDISVNLDAKTLLAGTYGRGLWRSDLVLDSSSIFFADFETQFAQICADSSVAVTITNNSFGDFDSLVWDFGADAVPQYARGEGPHQVSFPQKGYHRIELNAFNKWGQFTEVKSKAVESVDVITSLFAEDIVYHCSSEIQLLPASRSDLDWYHDGEKIFTGSSYSLSNRGYMQLYVEGRQGRCPARDSIVASFVPDLVCDAIEIGLGKWGPFSNVCATASEQEPIPDTLIANACNSQISWCPEKGLQNSVWFKFIAPPSGSIHIECPGFDNQIALYKADACTDIIKGGGYSLIAANDDYRLDDNSAVILQRDDLDPGSIYWLQVDGSAGGAAGEFFVFLSEYGELSADFMADTVSVSVGGKVQFADMSIGNPEEWEWLFRGGTPSSSNLQHPPAIVYSQEGTYDVRLIVKKGELSDTLTRKYFIAVSSDRFICDTVSNFSGTESLYMLDDNSFISGNNSFGDKALAEKFWVDGDEIEVAGMSVKWGFAKGNEQDDIRFHIYSGDNLPQYVVATSFVSLGEIISDYQYGSETYAGFNPRIPVDNNFFAGIALPQTIGDTIAVYSTAEYEAGNNTAFQSDLNGQWSSYKWLYGSNFNLKISVNVCYGPDKITSMSIGPVPAHKKLNLLFGRFDGVIQKVVVIDYLGKYVFVDSEPKFTGNKYVLNTGQFAAGVYVIKIESDKGNVTKRFVKY